MTQVTVGQTYQLRTNDGRAKEVTTQPATVTTIHKQGRGHTVLYEQTGKKRNMPMGKFISLIQA